MGLDMYLRARQHISNFHFYPEEQKLNKHLREALGLGHLDNDDASIQVTVGVCYWRKANQIHKWFVDECQGGIDDCRETYVDREKLAELLALCKETFETKDSDKLPTASGFFFGSTDVDDWYWDQIEYTIESLEKILNDEALKKYDFEYHSSW